MNVNDASETTAAHVDALIERIDPELIERIHTVTSESSGCRGNDVAPEQRVGQWENQRYIWFVGSVSPLGGLDVLDELVATQVADGWTAGRETSEGDGRRCSSSPLTRVITPAMASSSQAAGRTAV